MMQKKDLPVPTEFAKNLRQNQTDAEKIIWYALKAKRLEGYKFRRQFPIGNYIVDFACPEFRLVVEIDGGQHNGNPADDARTSYLNDLHYEVIRFWNNDVLKNAEGVLEAISTVLCERRKILKG